MDYIDGYKDAIEEFEQLINNEILKGNLEESEFANKIITRLHISKMQLSRMVDEYLESLEESYEEELSETQIIDLYEEFNINNPLYDENCNECESESFCRHLNGGRTMKEILELKQTKEEY